MWHSILSNVVEWGVDQQQFREENSRWKKHSEIRGKRLRVMGYVLATQV